eukprot:1180157-Prorocentrum_minimum.AAC.1
MTIHHVFAQDEFIFNIIHQELFSIFQHTNNATVQQYTYFPVPIYNLNSLLHLDNHWLGRSPNTRIHVPAGSWGEGVSPSPQSSPPSTRQGQTARSPCTLSSSSCTPG